MAASLPPSLTEKTVPKFVIWEFQEVGGGSSPFLPAHQGLSPVTREPSHEAAAFGPVIYLLVP